MHILIVEDSITQALLLKQTLEVRGCTVVMAKNGQEALKKIREKEPMLIISDIAMPVMDGCELSKRIKEDPHLSHIPVILITALSNPKDVIRAMQSGADNFITKPYEGDFLYTRIQNILENRRLRQGEKSDPVTISLFFDGEEHLINAERSQLMDLLLSSFEAAIEQNHRLMKKEIELREAKTATEEAYEQLQTSMTQLRKLSQAVEQSPVSVLITDRHGTIEYVNPIFSKITGYSSQEVVGENPRLWKSGQHGERFYQRMWKTILEGHVWQGEICNKKKSGEDYWESASIAPLFNQEGEITHFVAVREDVTERRQREEEFRIIIETAHDGFCITTLEGRILLVNKAYCEMTRYSKEELLEMSLVDLEVWKDERREHIETIQEKGFARYETSYMMKDGTLLAVEISVQASSFRGGSLILFARDISQRRQWEEKIQRHLSFEKMVAHISSSFVNIPLHKMEQAVQNALGTCGHFFQVDEIQVFQSIGEDSPLRESYGWWAKGMKSKGGDLSLELEDLLADDGYKREVLFSFRDEDGESWKDLEKQEELEEVVRKEGIKTFLSIPIIGGELTTFYCFYTIKEEKLWTDEELSLLKTLLEIISNAFARERTEKKIQEYTMEMELQSLKLEELNQHLDEEFQKAKEVHETTLVKTLPLLNEMTFAVHYQPAQKVGGDFYFCDTINEGRRVLIYLSDVTGHGLDGAMLSHFVKNTINSYLAVSKNEEITPEKILSFVTNQFRREEYPEDYFICIYLAILNRETLELSYLGAGFQDIPLLKRGEEEIPLINSGLPISRAISPSLMNTTSKVITLTPGSTLFFYTDGLTEQEVEGRVFGEKIQETFFPSSHLPPWIQVHTINEAFRKFNGGSLQGDDDITYLLLQIQKEETKRYHFQLESRLEELKVLRERIMDILSCYEEREFFMACLHEMVANAIEHGNMFCAKKRVFVEVETGENYISAIVEDEGEGFSWRERMDSSMDLKGERGRGRGINLTQSISSLFFYNREGTKAYFLLKRD